MSTTRAASSLLPALLDPEPLGVQVGVVLDRLRARSEPEALALAAWLSERVSGWQCEECGSTTEPRMRYTPPADHFLLLCADADRHAGKVLN